MSFDKIFDLTAGVYFKFYNKSLIWLIGFASKTPEPPEGRSTSVTASTTKLDWQSSASGARSVSPLDEIPPVSGHSRNWPNGRPSKVEYHTRRADIPTFCEVSIILAF